MRGDHPTGSSGVRSIGGVDILETDASANPGNRAPQRLDAHNSLIGIGRTDRDHGARRPPRARLGAPEKGPTTRGADPTRLNRALTLVSRLRSRGSVLQQMGRLFPEEER